ncbi:MULTISPECIES: PIG-L deacetylase family protein [unclassified Herbaspirillum]|uniref:PIG-L deacetylase family protein n=1 Tax=unclassified Herbaspirillum TaxID=2624150 RepID=UPI0011511A43|nr:MULTISPECIES: PIG-L deacetylase family protein [unclassified Herbaspirillum]MBB5392534.1 LmbE family N-acetylglucosaminyl deacetylase [Herbaspirillum sp. SJZ102]TQK06171.1 LmbE family N-acetylglucosaminyl deacetylase [Herbaspirillum sp. SJZ130]TQK12351.1 LmbE family N-acetylglucosaminyl deacetylase [Herbaspirillum sp. SJZ106]
MNKTVLVVAAHADDEALGCGGTIAKHAAEGDQVHVIFVADGVTSRNGTEPADLLQRQHATENARCILGISSVTFLNLPDNRLDGLPLLDVVQPLEALIGKLAPDIVYTHHYGDLNVDHRIVHQAAMTACRPMPGSTIREIFAFEVMSSTEWASPGLAPFLPNFFVDISAQLESKMQALEAYMLEMRTSPHSRSLEHMRCLAEHRGFCVGSAAAEAFMVMRVLR